MPTDHATQTAAAVLALRDLFIAICAGRPDGAALLERQRTAATLHVILDEKAGVIAFASKGEDGKVTWLDSVCCVPANTATFGKTPAQIVDADLTTTH